MAARSKYGSPGIAGDDGEDDGMGMENFKDLMQDRNVNEESSFVESAEKRDKVSMTFDQRMTSDQNDFESSRDVDSKASGVSAQRFGKRRKSAKGNYLRVRNSSNAKWSAIPGVGTLSGVSNAINDPSEAFDYFYKIIVIGDEFVGKTNFLLRISKGYYDPKPKTTYGVEFEFKTIALPNSNQKVKA